MRFAAAARRHVLAVTGWRTLGVRALVVGPDGRVALVRHTYTADQLYLPSGGVDRGEGYGVALTRELREELGIPEAPVQRLLDAYHARGEGRDDHVLVYVVTLDIAAAARVHAADSRELRAVEWVDPAQPPAGVSPATARRLAEYVAGVTGGGDW